MKKTELIQSLIEIEKEQDPKSETKITMNYVNYLKKLKKMIECGDIEI